MAKTLNPKGYRKVPTALTSIVAAATSTTLYQITTGRTSTAKLVKIFCANRTAGNIQLTIGETVAAVFTQRIPSILVVTGSDVELTRDQIPAFEFTSDIVAQASAAGAAPADVQVLVEVEESR